MMKYFLVYLKTDDEIDSSLVTLALCTYFGVPDGSVKVVEIEEPVSLIKN